MPSSMSPRPARSLTLPVVRTRGVRETGGWVRLAARRSLREQPPSRTQSADELLTRAVERLPLSGRGRARVARVAETIAALAGAEAVAPEHLAEALSYRPPVELTE